MFIHLHTWRSECAQYLQVLGWSMFFAGYIYLDRSWAKDQNTLKVGMGVQQCFCALCIGICFYL